MSSFLRGCGEGGVGVGEDGQGPFAPVDGVFDKVREDTDYPLGPYVQDLLSGVISL